MPTDDKQIREDVRRALHEDVGDGDLTAGLIPDTTHSEATVICREAAVFCGRPWFEETFTLLDPRITIDWRVEDGDRLGANTIVCTLYGPSRGLLTGERTALNFIQLLSGTATLASRYARAVEGSDVKVLDTRKTVPGLRLAQKYAVHCGGCFNHRQGLHDAILIKENHIMAAGSITDAVEQARTQTHDRVMVEVEVEDMHQLHEAMAAGVDRVLLDNMSPDELRQAVEVADGQVELEASGGIGLENIATFADTGVDFISVGNLTKDVRAIDFSMRFTFNRD